MTSVDEVLNVWGGGRQEVSGVGEVMEGEGRGGEEHMATERNMCRRREKSKKPRDVASRVQLHAVLYLARDILIVGATNECRLHDMGWRTHLSSHPVSL